MSVYETEGSYIIMMELCHVTHIHNTTIFKRFLVILTSGRRGKEMGVITTLKSSKV